MKKICPVCGKKVSHETDDCPECGADIDHLSEHEKEEAEKLEAEMEKEILRRGLAHEGHRHSDKEGVLSTEAAVEALEELTDIEDEEAEAIAQDVRQEYVHRFREQKERRRVLLRVALVALPILLIGVGVFLLSRRSMEQYDEVTYTAVFTSEVKNKEPVDHLTKVKLGTKVYLYIRWRGLESGSHDYRINVTDGAGAVAWDSPWRFSNRDATKSTWSGYKTKKSVDAPGKWKFEVFLEGKKIVEEYLEVVPE